MKVDDSHLSRNLFCGGLRISGEENDEDIHGFELFDRNCRAGAHFVLDGEAAIVTRSVGHKDGCSVECRDSRRYFDSKGEKVSAVADCDALALDLGDDASANLITEVSGFGDGEVFLFSVTDDGVAKRVFGALFGAGRCLE